MLLCQHYLCRTEKCNYLRACHVAITDLPGYFRTSSTNSQSRHRRIHDQQRNEGSEATYTSFSGEEEDEIYDGDDVLGGLGVNSPASESDYVPDGNINNAMNNALGMTQSYSTMPTISMNTNMVMMQSGSLAPSQLIASHAGLVSR